LAFEVFNKKAAGRLKKPTITVQKRGTLSMNAAAAAFLAGGEAPNELLVELLYDRERKVIGLRRTETENVNTYKVRKQPKSDSYLVAGKAFTQYYEIPTGEARRYLAKEFEDGILGAELAGDYSDVTREGTEEEEQEEQQSQE
jgi:hypothetical protein